VNRWTKAWATLAAITGLLGTAWLPIGWAGSIPSIDGEDAVAEWPAYRSDTDRFEIRYPSGFAVAKPAHGLVAHGAVVTFVPIDDPSFDETGRKSNLIALSVTVGVSESANGCAEEAEGRYPNFVRTDCCEGAVGNRYETTILTTDCRGSRYEIVLFVHSANPGCYPPGAVTTFDSAGIERMFETMARTFRPAI